ncbi:hypothetical protein pipiens_019385 [Culex pipiens pipiens]|uniref:Ubiquitin thioesterase OTU n=1 Tax=Culex pipiens pipiens TaxID=38569 RepID=A0ABD1DV75_CULPP
MKYPRYRFSFRDHSLVVQTIPGDGNCIFGAVVHQLLGLHPACDALRFAAERSALRRRVVCFLESNIMEFYEFLELGASDLGPAATIEDYLAYLSTEGVWGGEEVLAVTSRLYRCDILMWNSVTGATQRFESIHGSTGTLRVLYTGSHYDSIVSVDSGAQRRLPSGLLDFRPLLAGVASSESQQDSSERRRRPYSQQPVRAHPDLPSGGTQHITASRYTCQPPSAPVG